MSAPTIPVPEPAAQPEPAAEPAKVERPPLRDLLPTGSFAVLVATAGIALAVGSFARFGLTGHAPLGAAAAVSPPVGRSAPFGSAGRALLGAVFCPTLVLLAAIDLQHKVLPNM